MPLFEIVLVHNGSAEVRLTDEPTRVGDTILINDHDWIVTRSLTASAQAEARFECIPAVPLQPSPTPPG
jgi:hypothetical protein